MNLYGLFILDRHINVPMACKELTLHWNAFSHILEVPCPEL